jgi:predicted component of type VI protein secretion system
MHQQILLEWQFNETPCSYLVREGHAVLIGRQADCDVVVVTPTVSREHAVAFLAGDRLCLRNLSRTNPIRLGERPLATGETARLAPGESFQLGGVTFQVRSEPSEAARGATEPEVPAAAAGAAPDEGGLMLRCPRCEKLLEYDRRGYCPHCGLSRMNAETVLT